MPGLKHSPTSFYNISFDSNAPDHATNISQLFLGVRIECAKCHNHPWEKWTQDDFYGFAAFFARVGIKEVYENDENATQYMEEGSVEHPKTKKRVDAKFLDGGIDKRRAGRRHSRGAGRLDGFAEESVLRHAPS